MEYVVISASCLLNQIMKNKTQVTKVCGMQFTVNYTKFNTKKHVLFCGKYVTVATRSVYLE